MVFFNVLNSFLGVANAISRDSAEVNSENLHHAATCFNSTIPEEVTYLLIAIVGFELLVGVPGVVGYLIYKNCSPSKVDPYTIEPTDTGNPRDSFLLMESETSENLSARGGEHSTKDLPIGDLTIADDTFLHSGESRNSDSPFKGKGRGRGSPNFTPDGTPTRNLLVKRQAVYGTLKETGKSKS